MARTYETPTEFALGAAWQLFRFADDETRELAMRHCGAPEAMVRQVNRIIAEISTLAFTNEHESNAETIREFIAKLRASSPPARRR